MEIVKNLQSIIIIGVSLFFALVSVNNAYATCDIVIPTRCILLDSTSYYIDHGAVIIVTNPPDTSPPFITATVTSGVSGSTPVQLNKDPANPTNYVGIFYFRNSGYAPPSFSPDSLLPRVLSPVSPVSDILPDSIQVSSDAVAPLTASATVNSAQDGAAVSAWATPLAKDMAHASWKQSCGSSDSDGDFLCDSWEVETGTDMGLVGPTTPGAGSQPYKFPCNPTNQGPGWDSLVATPNPSNPGQSYPDPQCPTKNKKDIYLEIDYMKGHKPSIAVLRDVITAFANSPSGGIRLHIQLDEQLPLHQDAIATAGLAGGTGATEFDKIKKNYFGTAADRAIATPAGLNYDPVLTSKKNTFHYTVFIHAQQGSTASGFSELPGNDMVISMGDFTGGVGNINFQKGTLMHELGHNLGLDHGGKGAEATKNCKPNYLSVMSYSRQDVVPISDRPLNFSKGMASPLDETHLVESFGIGPTSQVGSPKITWSYVDPAGLSHVAVDRDTGLGIDWDRQNGISGMTSVSGSDMPQIMTCDVSGPSTSISDYNDWGNLSFDFRSPSSFTDTYRVPVVDPQGERLIINLKDDSPPNWIIQWVKDHWFAHHLHSYKIPDELNAQHVTKFRSMQITGIKYEIDNLSLDPADMNALDATLITANNATMEGNVNLAASKLVEIKNYLTSHNLIVTPSVMLELDNAINSHIMSAKPGTLPPQGKISMIHFLSPNYTATGQGIVRIIEPDMNLDPNSIDTLPISVWSDSDVGGINLNVNETDSDTGIFQGTIVFNSIVSSGNKLLVNTGDQVTAKYTDKTLPDPYLVNDTIKRIAETVIDNVPTSYLLTSSNPKIVDSHGNELLTVPVNKPVQITADVNNPQLTEQSFAYLVQINDNNGVTVSLAWITGSLASGQSLNPALSWMATSPGTYQIKISLWSSLDNPKSIAPELMFTTTVS